MDEHKGPKMDHSTTSFGQPLSILRNCYSCNCARISDMESQIIPPCERAIGRIPRDSIIVADNNNYLTSTVVENCSGRSISNPQLIRWSSSVNCIRKAPPVIPQHQRRKWWGFCLTALLTIILIVIGILLVTHYLQPTVSWKGVGSNRFKVNATASTTVDLGEDAVEGIKATILKSQIKIPKSVSKHAWFALQKNDARHSEQSVEDPIGFSISKDKVHRIPCGGGEPFRTPCCKLEKSTEILEHPGCAPIEVPKHQCVGGCDYVFIEGNIYASIPKCQPVRTRKLKFKLNCGEEVRRIAIEVASRCRCA